MNVKAFFDTNVLVCAAVGAGQRRTQEGFFVTVVRKAARPLVGAIAIGRSERFTISCWDPAILAAAEALGADTVYSET